MPLSHIEHFLVAADDIDATRDWYARVLGMKSGLDYKLIHQAISASGSSSGIFEVRGAMMAANDYKKGPECTNQASAARAHWVAEPSLALHWHFER